MRVSCPLDYRVIVARCIGIVLLLLFVLESVGRLAGQQADEATIQRYSRQAEQALAERILDAAARRTGR